MKRKNTMKIRTGFVSNSSSSSFIISYPRDKFYDADNDEELMNVLFVDTLPASLKEFLLDNLRELSIPKEEYYENENYLIYQSIPENKIDDCVEVVIERHSYDNTLSSLLCREPWSYLKKNNIEMEEN